MSTYLRDILEGIWQGVGCLIATIILTVCIAWPVVVWAIVVYWIWS